ncbi:FtsX-like permease family protein [Prolixibacteraceae bacterium JC049]|nr:FtsX-like permease family protein [Prolixibacteraceae bacterium JC049]
MNGNIVTIHELKFLQMNFRSNYLTFALRSLKFKGGHTIINLLGLMIGITAFVLIALWINTELSFDGFHKSSEQLYRVDYKLYEEDVLETHSAAAVPIIGPLLKKTYPEVQEYTRFNKVNGVIRYKDTFFKEKDILFADNNFLRLFAFPLKDGVKPDNLLDINKVIVSEDAAKRYFSQEDPVGKTITLNGGQKYYVSAVAKQAPENSHIQFDFLFSYENLIKRGRWFDNGWFGASFYTYVKVAPGTNIKQLQAKVPAIVEEHLGDFMKRAQFLTEFEFTALKDIHLRSNLQNELGVNGSIYYVRFMAIIAILVLFIAFINYINLATARIFERAAEVGVRKVLGALRVHLLWQFLTESLLVNIGAVAVSIGLILIGLPIFRELINSPVYVSIGLFSAIICGVFIVSVITTGLFPSWYVSRLNASKVLRSKGSVGSKRMTRFRSGMLVMQFAISIILIIGTIVINRQMNFMKVQNLGVNIDQMLVVQGPQTSGIKPNQVAAFRAEMARIPQVQGVAVSTNIPGEEVRNQPVYGKVISGVNTEKKIRMIGIDSYFMETYQLKLLAGRNFDTDHSTKVDELILNESALAYMGFKDAEDAIGKELSSGERKARIIGVVNDYNQKSLKELPPPMLFSNFVWGRYYSIKVKSADVPKVIPQLKKEWEASFAGNPLNYFFLDDHFDAQYKSDYQFGNMFLFFSVLAVVIACMGLFGLSAYATSKRIKEIGVRKVNGARVDEILLLLNKDFMLHVLVAFVIAVPVGMYVMQIWLEEFAYRTSLSWWIFGIAGFVAALISFATVSWQSWKAATRNPVEAIRYE